MHAGLTLDPPFHFRDVACSLLLPFPEFGMAVGEAQNTAVVMTCCWKINPAPFMPLGHGKAGIVYAAFVFVDEHKCFGWGRGNDLGIFVPTRPVRWQGNVVHVHVHRHAPESGNLAPVSNRGCVGGAFINLD